MNLLIYMLRFVVGMIWLVAIAITAILLAPFQLYVMLSAYVWQPQNIRY